jgi:hypothetical protein
MGCYNTVKFKCIGCQNTISEQTKNGDCSLYSSDISKADVSDIIGISDYPIECDNCNTLNIVKINKIFVDYKIEIYNPNEEDDDNE